MNFAIPKMDIFFLIKLRKKYTHINDLIESVIEEYNSIIQDPQALLTLHMDSNIYNSSTQIIKKRDLCKEELMHVKDTINQLNLDIINGCNHDFVDDSIDIDCDKSCHITYCTICEYTKP